MVVRRSALQRSGDKNVSQTPFKRICAQYGFRFFWEEKSKFVASTAKRQRGLQRGKPGSPLPCFASFCRSKRKAPAASGANYAFAKGPAAPTGEKIVIKEGETYGKEKRTGEGLGCPVPG